MDELENHLEELKSILDMTCCVCTHPMEETQIKHHVEDMDGYTWGICDECWQRIRDVMKKEEADTLEEILISTEGNGDG